MNEEKLKEHIIAILIDYEGKGYTTKTIERLINLFYEAQSKKRSPSQNSAIHRDCQLVADKLEAMGLDMKKVIRLDIPPTMQNVKDNIFKPIMKFLYKKTSTTELEKGSGEIDKIHQVMMRELGKEWGVEYHDFPHKKKEPEKKLEYPTDYKGEPKF